MLSWDLPYANFLPLIYYMISTSAYRNSKHYCVIADIIMLHLGSFVESPRHLNLTLTLTL